MPKTIYLANPYGFSAQQKAELLRPLVSRSLRSLGWRCGSRSRGTTKVDFAEAGWAYHIGG